MTHDIGNLEGSALVDPDTGFGGNGVGEDHCIQDGPFAGFVNSLGPGYTFTDHCIHRDFNQTYMELGGEDFIAAAHRRKVFVEAEPYFQAGPHNGGHSGIGGLVSLAPHPRPLIG
ncbi:hypothetical protein IMZ48_50045 [Candidatus Bathyarchaeota archaeon]|nr:hypothetical protein [Candidatus Bathyarchaeota archaeon]